MQGIMENIINLQNSSTENSKLLRISYIEISPESIDYDSNDILNIRIASKSSIFQTPFDIYCVYRDTKYIFNSIPIPIKSDTLDYNSTDFRSELIKYLKHYFRSMVIKKMNSVEYSNFLFRHNIHKIRSKDIYINFYKKYMQGKLISVDNCDLEIYTGNKNKFFNDLLKIESNLLFYTTILRILPIDILTGLIKTLREDNIKVLIYYKIYKMYRTEYPKLSFVFLQNIISILRDSVNIEAIDYFKTLSVNLITNKNWYYHLKKVDDFYNKLDIDKYGMVTSKWIDTYHENNTSYEIKLKVGNKIWKEDSLVFNKDNHKFICDKLIIDTEYTGFLNKILVESNDKFIEIPVYKHIEKRTEILINFDYFCHEEHIKITKFIFEDTTILVNYDFVYINRSNQLNFKIHTDLDFRIYEMNKTQKIFYDKFKIEKDKKIFLFVSRGEISKLVYEISDNYLEEIIVE